jgi:hypothetical protein
MNIILQKIEEHPKQKGAYVVYYLTEDQEDEYVTLIKEIPPTDTLGFRIAIVLAKTRKVSSEDWKELDNNPDSDLIIALENEFVRHQGYYFNRIPAIPNKDVTKEKVSELAERAKCFYNIYINGMPLNHLSVEQRGEWENIVNEIKQAVHITENHRGLNTLISNCIWHYCENKITKEQLLHIALVTTDEFSWYQQFAFLTGNRVHRRLFYEVSRIANCLVNMNQYHNPESGFSEWKADAPLYALEAQKYLASLW